jgi:hypothetical protein
MPQSTPQRNQKTPVLARRPQPLPDLAESETDDHVYGIVSVLYHSLQGAQACEQYVGDAERAGDEELVKFFEECREQQQQRAQRAKQLLVQRADEEDDEEEDEQDDR